jgi:proline iminopeptidase
MAERGVVERDGFALEWVREGEGTPMIVVGAHRYYRRAFPAELRRHFDVVFCDTRQWAAGPAGFDVSTITMATLVEDLEAVRAATGLEHPIVAGHSMHTRIAFAYALHHPDRVRGVLAVAAEPPGGVERDAVVEFFLADASPERVDTYVRRQEGVHATVTTAREYIENYLAQAPGAWCDLNYDGAWLWEGVEPNIAAQDHINAAPEGFGGERALPESTPIFVANGRYDYGIPYRLWEERKDAVPNLTYRLYERGGHTPQLEQAEEFTADVVAWATTLAAPAPGD